MLRLAALDCCEGDGAGVGIPMSEPPQPAQSTINGMDILRLDARGIE
jgi:hypothetical protein